VTKRTHISKIPKGNSGVGSNKGGIRGVEESSETTTGFATEGVAWVYNPRTGEIEGIKLLLSYFGWGDWKIELSNCQNLGGGANVWIYPDKQSIKRAAEAIPFSERKNTIKQGGKGGETHSTAPDSKDNA